MIDLESAENIKLMLIIVGVLFLMVVMALASLKFSLY